MVRRRIFPLIQHTRIQTSLTQDLMGIRPIYAEDLCWSRVSSMEPSHPEANTLPQGH
ncbi:hypothetical protein AVEN_228074-1, partial [Araneus ventricosus]